MFIIIKRKSDLKIYIIKYLKVHQIYILMAYDYLFISVNEQSWVNIELHALKKKTKITRKKFTFYSTFYS